MHRDGVLSRNTRRNDDMNFNEVNTIKRFDVSNYTRVGRIPFNYLAFSRFRGHDS